MTRNKNLTLKALRSDERYLNVNITGNKKLINNKETGFIIWNIPAIVTCPYATKHCKGLCYARKSEKAYPDVLPSRQVNFNNSRKDSFADDMIYTLSVEIGNNEKKGKKTIVRIHESGDFYNQTYTDAWLKIASAFTGRNVVFMAYTKSVKYFTGRNIPENMVVRYSVWDDTKKADIELASDLELPTYSADTENNVNAKVLQGIATKCDCKDCANCGKCWDKSVKAIECVIH